MVVFPDLLSKPTQDYFPGGQSPSFAASAQLTTQNITSQYTLLPGETKVQYLIVAAQLSVVGQNFQWDAEITGTVNGVPGVVIVGIQGTSTSPQTSYLTSLDLLCDENTPVLVTTHALVGTQETPIGFATITYRKVILV